MSIKTLKLIIGCGLLLFALLYFDSCGRTQSVTVPITVKSGDTLYGIIAEQATKYGDVRDLREICYEARKDNGKETSHIFPGEVLNLRLEVPAKENDR